MKLYIKLIFILILIIFFTSAFSSSYTSHSLENIAYVTAIGFDKGEEKKYKITFQFINVSGLNDSSSNEPAQSVVIYVDSNSLNNALDLANSYIGKEINLSHCDIILFSKEIAEKGISEEIFTLINNEELRPTADLVICDTSCYDYIKNEKPNLERLVTRYYMTFGLTGKYTGFTDETTIGQFYNKLSNSNINNTCIYGYVASEDSDSEQSSGQSSKGSSSGSSGNSEDSSDPESSSKNLETDSPAGVVGKRKTQNFGVAVFKEDKFIGVLDETESICHQLLTNELVTCILSIPSPEKAIDELDISISPIKKTKISVDTSSNTPKIYIDLYLQGNLLTQSPNNLNRIDFLEKCSKDAEKYLKEKIERYLNKTANEYNSDIVGFGKYAIMNYLTNKEWKKYNWEDKYSKAEFFVNVNVTITSSLLLTDLE